jgi:hypothetical protein
VNERWGVELPDVYDGISVWVEPDGTVTNRWDWYVQVHPNELTYRRRQRKTQEWIDEHLRKPTVA